MGRVQYARELAEGDLLDINVMISCKSPDIRPRSYHWHDFDEILYVRSGECILLHEGERYFLPEGSIVQIGPYELHQTLNSGTDAAELIVVQHAPHRRTLQPDGRQSRYLLPFLTSGGGFSGIMLPPYGDAEQFGFLFSNLYTEFRARRDRYENLLAGYLSALLTLIGRHMKVGNRMSGDVYSPNPAGIAAICSYIEGNCSNTLMLSRVAEHFGYSRTYFSSLFVRQTGYRYRDFLRYVLFREAHIMLNFNKMARKEVASRLGYTSVSNFNRAYNKMFEKYYGQDSTLPRQEQLQMLRLDR